MNASAASSLTQANSNSSASASGSLINNHTNATAGATAALPNPVYSNSKYAGSYNVTRKYQEIRSGNCSVKELYCSPKGNNRTVGKANATSIDDPCLLWDPSCSGNRTSAIDTFFDPTFQQDLLSNRCFVVAGSVNLANVSKCDRYNPPDRMSEFQKMKNWMRSQQCASAATEWAAHYESGLDPSSEEAILNEPDRYHIALGANPSCCGPCETNVKNADIYYWPEPDANTSCLSIIGDNVRPIDFGATRETSSTGTTTSTDIYWDCEPKPSTYYNSLQSESVTDTYPIRTAMITNIGSLSVKVYLADPWSPSPCTESDVMSQGSNKSAQIRDRHVPMHARGHTLIIPSSVTLTDNLPVTTMVSGNFTL